MSDLIPLGNRYSSAWLEHSTRIAQRQNVVQIYITATGVMFGFFFSKSPLEPDSNVYLFLIVGVTFLTVVCSVFLWLHHRVMQHLLTFMKDCEQQAAAEQAKSSGNHTKYLFYFCSQTDNKNVDSFHSTQRCIHRIVLSLILIAANSYAIALCWDHVENKYSIVAIIILVAAVICPYFDLSRDSGD